MVIDGHESISLNLCWFKLVHVNFNYLGLV
jgi:hypothetical protein